MVRAKAKDVRTESAEVKGKTFGDAMRISAIHESADPVDAIPFYRALA